MKYQTCKQSGFTLVEIMIVIVLIGFLATMAVPAIKKVKLHAQASTIVNDLRVYVGAFRTYYLEEGSFPAVAPGNQFPTEMRGWIEEAGWQDGATKGTSWQYWNPYRGQPTITLYSSNAFSTELLLLIEQKIDDSNLNGGILQRSGNYLDYFWNELPN